MTAEQIIRAIKNELKKVHNTRFTVGDTNYRIEYEGGIAEYIAVYGRKKGGLLYRFVDGFYGYNCHTKDQAIDMAKSLINESG